MTKKTRNGSLPEISIIIVNWNTRELTLKCLQSIYTQESTQSFEIILVDNASSDGSVAAIREDFPDVLVVQNDENLGYARANNQGIRQARGQFIILQNSDTQLKTPGTFTLVTEFLKKNEDVGFLGARLVYPNGALQAAGRKFISVSGLIKSQLLFTSAPIAKKIKDKFKSFKTPESHFCDYVDGAFLVTRQKVLDEIGLLDESFFMYGEDMEWCARAQKASWKVAVLNNVEVIHFHAQSSQQNYQKVLFENTKNNCRIIKKQYGFTRAVAAFYVYLLGMILRIFLSVFRNRRQVKDYWIGVRNCWAQRNEILKG